MRKILITNDDGIRADGIIRLARAATKFGDVTVVAPRSQRSAMSHSITLRTYIDLEKMEFPVEGVEAYACSGTPADCVRIGCLNVIENGPDVVFSGINFGYNCATDLQYSATAGAAFEAAFQGISAVAFSEHMSDCHEVTDKYLEEIIEELIDKNPGKNRIWNVNFPGCSVAECKGIKRDVTVSSGSVFTDRYDQKKIDEVTTRYMVNGIFGPEGEEGSDLKAIFDNYVSVGIARNIGG